MEKMLRRYDRRRHRLGSGSGTALGQVQADPGQIEQVIMNLVVNARDAMPSGGKLTIETTNVTDWTKRYRGCLLARFRRYVLLPSAIPARDGFETQAHIFEPFFTTKGPEGTGLGLRPSTESSSRAAGISSSAA